MDREQPVRQDALIDLGAASIETKGNLMVNQDTDPGYRDLFGGISSDD